MKWLRGLVPLLIVAACSPPAAQAPKVAQVSEQARATMQRINNANDFSDLASVPAIPASAVPEDVTIAPGPGDTTLPAGDAAGEVAPAPGANANAAPNSAAANAANVQNEATPGADVHFNATMVRVEVALDRAHFSPGVIDGYNGDNVRKAVSAYQAAHNLPVNGVADTSLLQALTAQDQAPALISYTITADDVAGPFAPVPQDFEAMSHLQHLGYARASEGIAEKFHMDENLLKTLNPGVDFTQAGASIIVANAGVPLTGQVASIVIDKTEKSLRAYDASGQLLAFYPASIGSPDAPAPSGDYAVRSVAFNPVYHYDPARLPAFHDTRHGPLTIAAGPNNPVGVVWIALTLPTYGIHGAPEPQNVSKTQSHGCIRLTNWDAAELAHAVRPGVPVSFQDRGLQAASPGAQPG
jgi:lipoprotein-anchoring transpeptidase ErfK/SrfK